MSAKLVPTIVVLPIQDGNHSSSPQITPPAPKSLPQPLSPPPQKSLSTLYLAFSNVAAAVFPIVPNPTPTAKPSVKKAQFRVKRTLCSFLLED